uniref:Gypsy retrotransposon integrase-like protein 1 n=1 Tax=Astyanax mexicanus TaxID=7994 RepID=A0A3B1KDF6_ASTMX
MDQVIRQLLEANLTQQGVTQDLARGLREVTGELLAARRASTAAALPDPRKHAHQLLTKLGPADDIEAYLYTFECIAEREVWEKEQWAEILAPFLTGEAQLAYYALPPEDGSDYEKLKEEILARVGLGPSAAAAEFHRWGFKTSQPPRPQMTQLLRTAKRWLQPEQLGPEAVTERVVMDHYLRSLPLELRKAVGLRNPTSAKEMVEATEMAESVLTLSRPEKKESASSGRPDLFGPTRPELKPHVHNLPRPRFFGPRPREPARSPQDEPMPTEPEPSPSRPQGPKAWLAGCRLHGMERGTAPTRLLCLDGRKVEAILDTGSTVTLARPTAFPWLHPGPESIQLSCVHGDQRQVPTARVHLGQRSRNWELSIGLVPDLPVPLLVGRDYPNFDEELRGKPERRMTPRRRRKRRPVAPRALAASAHSGSSEPASEGEHSPPSNPLFMFHQQARREGCLSREQREDERLREVWKAAREVNGEPKGEPNPVPPYFIIKDDLAYRVADLNGERVEQMLVPRGRTRTILHLAHQHPLGGHLATDNTLARILRRFYWPSIRADVSRYCRSCSTCQLTSPYKPPPAPLVPLPIIETPYQRLGMDIVGPLPKSGRGHEYILVMVDYATRYPDAVPLRKATSKAIAKELVLLMSRVGIPKEILTDQGTPFVSKLMNDLCRLLQVKRLTTSVWHPQTDGLVERFNQTLKKTLKRLVTTDPRNWDLLLPHALFAIREIPQASTGFSPFELLYGRNPRGLLDLVKDAWESQPSPFRSVIDHVQDLQNHIKKIMPIVKENMEQAQQAQARVYNRPARLRTFQPGDRVMVLIPTSTCKFLASWQGPYTITERLSEVNYRVEQPGRRKREQVYHINLLKEWHEPPPPPVSASSQVCFAEHEPEIPTGEDLTPAQRQELKECLARHRSVFSESPGRTQVIHHRIPTEPGKIVRQRPYRLPEARRKAVEEEVRKMLQLQVIEPSASPWSSPIVLVPKPDGSWRFCNDFRRLNSISRFDSYPMPRVDDLIDRLGKARYVSTLDLTKGYWQVPLAPKDREKTAFATPSGLWHYTVLPFGLHGAPATFQRLMDVVLRPHQSFAAAYLDDVIVHSETWGEHLAHLHKVLSAIHQAGLTANPRKCHLGLTEAAYLGYRIGRGLLRPQQQKVDAVSSWPTPRNKTDVRAFLGLASYYRRFVPHFATLATPLTALLKKDQPDEVQWSEDAQAAFAALKKCLTSEPVLRNPDFNLPFILHTDASDTGLGAVLVQEFHGEEHPILYISRALNPAEKRYAALEREALAIKWAVEELRYFLTGRQFTLVTDHAPLQWVSKHKDTNARVTRWFLALQEFSFQVRHRPGVAHADADGLSRRFGGGDPVNPALWSQLRGGSVAGGADLEERRRWKQSAVQHRTAPSCTAFPCLATVQHHWWDSGGKTPAGGTAPPSEHGWKTLSAARLAASQLHSAAPQKGC